MWTSKMVIGAFALLVSAHLHAATALGGDLKAALDRTNAGSKTGKGTVLVVITAASEIPLANGKMHATGYFLRELIDPLKEVLLAGYDVEFATPDGKAPVVDRNSLKLAWDWYPRPLNAQAKLDENLAIKNALDVLNGRQQPKTLEQALANENNYVGMLVPGGHGPMVDLRVDKNLGAIIRDFHSDGKPMAFICHGPVALMSAQSDDGSWPFKGYHISVVSTDDEHLLESNLMAILIGRIEGKLTLYPDQLLEGAGAIMENSPIALGAPSWTRDREVITSQNPAGATPVGKILAKSIRERQGLQAADTPVNGIPFVAFADLAKMSRAQLKALFSQGVVDRIPLGDTAGMGLIFIGEPRFDYLSTYKWQGKIFQQTENGVVLVNKILGTTKVLGTTVDASVTQATSQFDGQPAIRLDYSQSATIWARPIVDEIRKIGPDLYLGRVTAFGRDLGFFTLYFVD